MTMTELPSLTDVAEAFLEVRLLCNPSLGVIAKVAEALKVAPDELLKKTK